MMEKLESVQYSAALVITGTWRGTSREKLYTELGWELLSSRRWSRRLTLLYKFVNNLSPEYTVDPIPPFHQSQYCLRDQDVIGQMRARTEKCKSSFYPNCLSEWNKLDPELKICFRNSRSNRITLSYSTQGCSQQVKFSQIQA